MENLQKSPWSRKSLSAVYNCEMCFLARSTFSLASWNSEVVIRSGLGAALCFLLFGRNLRLGHLNKTPREFGHALQRCASRLRLVGHGLIRRRGWIRLSWNGFMSSFLIFLNFLLASLTSGGSKYGDGFKPTRILTLLGGIGLSVAQPGPACHPCASKKEIRADAASRDLPGSPLKSACPGTVYCSTVTPSGASGKVPILG